MMASPTYAISVEFVTGSFTNVSSDVLRFNCERRVANLFNDLGPSNATVELANESGKYSPLNAASPFFPNLRSQKRLKISASYLGNALVCDGTSSPGIVPDAPEFRVSSADSFTVEAWASTTSNLLMALLSTRSGSNIWWTAGVQSGHPALELGNNWPTHYSFLATTSLMSDGAAHHVAFVRDAAAGQLSVYLNGSLSATAAEATTSGFSLDPGAIPVGLASTPDPATGWSPWQAGNLDQVGFYRRALPASEVAAHAVGSFGGNFGLVALWGFDETAGKVAYDSVGPNDATLAGYAPRTLGLCPTQSYDLFTGFLSEVDTNVDRTQRTTVLQAQDGINRLDNSTVTTSLFTDVNPASFFTAVMSQCAVNSFAVDALVDSIPFAWARDRTGADVVRDLLNFGYYSLYQDGAGTLQLKNRFGALALSVTSLTRYLDFSYVQNEDQLLNSAKLAAQPRAVSPTTNTVAWLQSVLALPASSGIGFWLTYVDPAQNALTAPATSMVAPVSSADYLTNTQSNGLGADGTSVTSASVTFFGEAAVCSLWNGGSNNLYVTKFQLRGNSARLQSPFASQVDNSSSQAVYGKHAFALEGNDYLGNKPYVDAYAQALVLDRKEERPQLTVSIKNDFPNIFKLEVAQLVSLVEPITSVNGQYAVRNLTHDVQLANGLEHVLKLEVDTFVNKNNLILDNAVFGKLDSGNTLAF